MKSKTLDIHTRGSVVSLSFPHIDETGLTKHGFSTKHGGMSNGYYSTMNLSKSRGDFLFCVEENFNRFTDAVGVTSESLVFSDQIHETVVRRVSVSDCGKGFNRTSDIVGVDGLMTNERGVTLTTFYADCVPLFFLDPQNKAIALSHAGWRGTVKGIGPKTVEALEQAYDSYAGDILVGIGPSIGQCCYEVSEDVINEFENRVNRDIIDKIVTSVGNGRYMLNLWEANRLLLIEAGIKASNIIVTDLCTKCHSEDFFSHRVMGTERGSLAAMMALR